MIQDPRLRQLFELKKSIDVFRHSLSNEGLVIDYSINGISKVIATGPAETCSLLKEAGLIQDYFWAEFYYHLIWETETNTERGGEHIQECKTVYGSFADFVEQTKFSLNDANEVAAFYELRKITNNQKTLA